MNTEEYIINDVRPFSLETTVKEVQNTFNNLTYSHLPVFNEGTYLGCISETDAHCFESDKTLLDVQYALEGFFVREKTNWLDVLEAFAQYNSNIMPVLDDNQQYLGYFELGDIMNLFSETPFLHEAGGIIIVEKGVNDYSFSEICQIVESNDARLLGVFVSHMENDLIQATVKIAPTGINTIVQTFRRYGYNIVSQHAEDTYMDSLKELSKYLDKYLNM